MKVSHGRALFGFLGALQAVYEVEFTAWRTPGSGGVHGHGKGTGVTLGKGHLSPNSSVYPPWQPSAVELMIKYDLYIGPVCLCGPLKRSKSTDYEDKTLLEDGLHESKA